MSRILLLLPFILWLAYTPEQAAGTGLGREVELLLFFAGSIALVLLMGLWSRMVARRVASNDLQRSLRRFNRMMTNARLAVPAWYGLGVFVLGWGPLVTQLLAPLRHWPVELPAVLLGTAPAFAMWMGLWWSQYPADRALREQNLLIQLNDGLPAHAPPGFASYFTSNLRLQLLFIAVPVLLIIAVRDLAAVALQAMGLEPYHAGVESAVLFGSSALVFIAAPEILRHVLHTQPLPNSPLRRRLEALCRRTNLRYRDILLWRTDNNMGNAAVMGIVPQVRYILLSDLLLETMSDQQIEAVFAHEIGHIVHRHMAWYIVMVMILALSMVGVGTAIDALLGRYLPQWMGVDLLMGLLSIAAFFLLFGYLSRWFERQADVYAARTIQHALVVPITGTAPPQGDPLVPSRSYVGEFGAAIFASALHRVAIINNIPIGARNFSHGSIASRMHYLHELSADPSRTNRFDAFMRWLYASMLTALAALGVLIILQV